MGIMVAVRRAMESSQHGEATGPTAPVTARTTPAQETEEMAGLIETIQHRGLIEISIPKRGSAKL